MGAETSDLELLTSALQDAVDAYQAGVIIGPTLDVVALRRAFRQDMAQALRTATSGEVA